MIFTMTNKTILMTSLIAMTFLLGFSVNSAYAQVTSYSDFASFDSATENLTFIDFEDQIIECDYFDFDPFPFNPCSPSPH